MNHRMSDFEWLHERAREEEKEERELPALTNPSLGPSWAEEAARAEELRELAELNNRPIVTATQQPRVHNVETCRCLRCAHERVASGIQFKVNCAGCGNLKEIGTNCPCGYTEQRDRDLQAQERFSQVGQPQPHREGCVCLECQARSAMYVQEIAGRYRHFSGCRCIRCEGGIYDGLTQGTRTGRMSSAPNQQFITRDFSDAESRMERLAVAHITGGPVPTADEVRNVPCEVCGRVERIFASMAADGHFTCRRCREVTTNRESYLAEQQAAQENTEQRFMYEAKCARVQCSRTSQRFRALAACREYVLVRNRVCPACHYESLGVQEVDTQREARRAELRRSAIETLNSIDRQPIPAPTPRVHVRDIPFTPAARDDEDRNRIERERLTFQLQMSQITGREADAARARLAEMDRQEELERRRAEDSFKPARKLDLD